MADKEVMTISDVIEKLKEIKKENGDLECYSVNYHSDFVDVPLIKNFVEIDPPFKIGQINGKENYQFEVIHSQKTYLLIYGGSR